MAAIAATAPDTTGIRTARCLNRKVEPPQSKHSAAHRPPDFGNPHTVNVFRQRLPPRCTRFTPAPLRRREHGENGSNLEPQE